MSDLTAAHIERPRNVLVRRLRGEADVLLVLEWATLSRQWRLADLFAAARDMPREKVPLGDFPELDSDIWYQRTGKKPTVRNIVAKIRRIWNTDLAYPAIVVDGVGLVDGTHRLAKACLMGATTLECVRFSLAALVALPHATHDLPQGPRKIAAKRKPA